MLTAVAPQHLNRPFFADIYQGDEVIDKLPDGTPQYLGGFVSLKNYGVPFLAHKASEGTTEHDERYAARRPHWMSGGSVEVTDVDGTVLHVSPMWMAYHFFHGQDPVAESKNFLTTAKLIPTDAACLDWENVGPSGYAPTAVEADDFCCRVEDARGQACWVYGGNVPREQTAVRGVPSVVLQRMEARPLWFCCYLALGKIISDIPEIWQKVGPAAVQNDGDKYGAGPTRLPGVQGYCDNSTVIETMTVAKLAQIWPGNPLQGTTAPTQAIA
jgi:hypothetical protein